MAESKSNVVTHGLSGMVGDMLVFRQRAGKTIVAGKPHFRDLPVTPAQQTVRDRFRDGVAYAKGAIRDELIKAAYQAVAAPGQSAFNVAFIDFMNAPVFNDDNTDLSGYTGAAGESLKVYVTDDFKVAQVDVVIHDGTDAELEQGMAVIAENGLDWVYTTTKVNPALAGSKITFTASDLAGNKTILEKTLS